MIQYVGNVFDMLMTETSFMRLCFYVCHNLKFLGVLLLYLTIKIQKVKALS